MKLINLEEHFCIFGSMRCRKKTWRLGKNWPRTWRVHIELRFHLVYLFT